MSITQVQAIEQNIKEAKKTVALGEALERLKNNRDFKAVVLEEYFKAEAVRLVHLKAEESMQTPARQASILAQMDAIGGLQQFLHTMLIKASMASKAVAADEATRDEILAEGSEE